KIVEYLRRDIERFLIRIAGVVNVLCGSGNRARATAGEHLRVALTGGVECHRGRGNKAEARECEDEKRGFHEWGILVVLGAAKHTPLGSAALDSPQRAKRYCQP